MSCTVKSETVLSCTALQRQQLDKKKKKSFHTYSPHQDFLCQGCHRTHTTATNTQTQSKYLLIIQKSARHHIRHYTYNSFNINLRFNLPEFHQPSNLFSAFYMFIFCRATTQYIIAYLIEQLYPSVGAPILTKELQRYIVCRYQH